MYINNSAIKRIAKDVKYILNNEESLSKENIYYKHDDENVFKGYALIIGNHFTPYAYGYYFFEFTFPENYPFAPPVVNYLTTDGVMRFNPNLYSNGKVCLSILNTWTGENWSACQSIFSILFTLVTVLCDNPLLNEPGITEEHYELTKYNYLVFYKNIEFSIATLIGLINNNSICDNSNNSITGNNSNNSNNSNNKVKKIKFANNIEIMCKFNSIVNTSFKNNKTNILELINANKIKYSNFVDIFSQFRIVVYNLNYSLNYNKLYDLINIM